MNPLEKSHHKIIPIDDFLKGIFLNLLLIIILEVVFSRHTKPPTGVNSMSILSPVTPEHIASEKLLEPILQRLEFRK